MQALALQIQRLEVGTPSYALSTRCIFGVAVANMHCARAPVLLSCYQASRNALLEEVSYLSMRNSQLEEQCASVPTLQAEAEALGKRTEMLLVMLGEKEEELEAALGDMREVKHMYRAHLDELLEKANPPLPEAAEPQPSIV
jgi:hypothetical protein